MTEQAPRVSVGLAVYNGESFLEEALDSILGQTFADYELIVSDNASTDRTAEICRDYQATDRRIRYYRNDQNIGGANNENRTFALSRGEYFRWAAHDDVCAPELLARCVDVLDHDDSIVLCSSAIVEIDAQGNHIRTTRQRRAESGRPDERFRDLAFRDHNCEATYGLIRSAILRRTRLQLNYTDSDRTLLCELGLYGRFHEISEPLFFKRYHPKNHYLDRRDRMAWFYPALRGEIVLPNCMQAADLLVTINRVPLSKRERLRCLAVMAPWLRAYGKYVAKDLVVALYGLAHSKEWRYRNAGPRNWE